MMESDGTTSGYESVFICARCGQESPEPGACPKDPGEPLLDTQDPSVLQMLMQLDDEARRRTYLRWMGLTVTVGLILGIIAVTAIHLAWPGSAVAGRVQAIFFILSVLSGAGIGLYIARQRYRRRFEQYTIRLLDPFLSGDETPEGWGEDVHEKVSLRL